MKSRPFHSGRRQFIRGLAATAAFGAAPSAPLAAERAVSIIYVPSTLFAPLFVAVERGYFSKAGVAVRLTPIGAGQHAVALVAAGKVDVAATGLSAAFFNAARRSLPVRLICSAGYQPQTAHPSALMIREDLYESGHRDVGALRGRKVAWGGGGLGATAAYHVARILRPAGLRLKDIEPVSITNPDLGIALKRKAIAAAFSISPYTEIITRQKLARVIAYPPAGVCASGFLFGPTLLKNDKKARSIANALRRGARDLQGDAYFEPEVLAAIAAYIKQPLDISMASSRYDFDSSLQIDWLTLEDMQRVYHDAGVLTYREPLGRTALTVAY